MYGLICHFMMVLPLSFIHEKVLQHPCLSLCLPSADVCCSVQLRARAREIGGGGNKKMPQSQTQTH